MERRRETDPADTDGGAGAVLDPVVAEDGEIVEDSQTTEDGETAEDSETTEDGETAEEAGDSVARDGGSTPGADDDTERSERTRSGAKTSPARRRTAPARAKRDQPAAADPSAQAGGHAATGTATGDLPVRPPGSRKVGRRRAVGPVIGDQLATELLGDHRQDVLLSDRCSCGEPFPCRSRAFATCFVLDRSYPPPDLEMPYRIVPPELRVRQGPRHAASAPEPVVTGSPRPVDLDATVQFAKVPVEPPVAVAS